MPYYCRGCGKVGQILCDSCLADLLAGDQIVGYPGDTAAFLTKSVDFGDLSGLFVGGWREGVLKQLVEEYKFSSARAAASVLAQVVSAALPDHFPAPAATKASSSAKAAPTKSTDTSIAPESVAIVPLPTIGRHIRERGFDHTARLAVELTDLRGYTVIPLLLRQNKTVQVGTDAETREKQASAAYAVDPKRLPEVEGKTILLLDDVWTTGASMRAAAAAVRQATNAPLYAAVVEMGR